MMLATKKRAPEVLRLLIGVGKQPMSEKLLRRSLYVHCEEGHTEVVQLLLDNSANVNAEGGRYGNALSAASLGGHRETVQLLIDNSADVNAQGGLRGNALQAALSGGHREIVQLLQASCAPEVSTNGEFLTAP